MATWALPTTPLGRNLLLVGILFCSLVSVPQTSTTSGNVVAGAVAVAAAATATSRTGDKLKIEGGWSEVKNGWPTDDEDYFLATEKGHHFIESQNLPSNLKSDLMVELKYYYSYSKTKPVLQMTPCTKNIFLETENSADQSNRWITHKQLVKKSDCATRNEIAYNVLLHDQGDVFAWKVMKIQSIAGQEQEHEQGDTTTTTTRDPIVAVIDEAVTVPPESPIANTVASNTDESTFVEGPPKFGVNIGTSTTTSTTTPTTTSSSTTTTTTTAAPSTTSTTSTTTPTTTSSSSTTTTTTTTTAAPSTTSTTSTSTTTTRPAESETNREGSSPGSLEDSNSEAPAGASSDEEGGAHGKGSDDKADANLNQRRRRKRDTEDDQDGGATREPQLVNASCAPSSCNRHQFKMDRFSALIKGLPKRPARAGADTSRYLVNLKNRPLSMKIESDEESLADVDTCVSLLLYMEANTELEFLLAGENGAPERLLESIKRKPGDSTAGRWDTFQRCISDYMPQFSAGTKAAGASGGDNSMRLLLRPRGAQQAGQTAVLIANERASYLAHLHRKQSFLPDIKRLRTPEDFRRHWIVDRDGLAKPEVVLSNAQVAAGGAGATTTTRPSEGEKLLHITRIDPSQETFDMTTRWLQIRDAETLELPIQFVYKAEPADWVDRLEFQFQRAGDPSDEWISQVAYKAPVAQAKSGLARTSSAQGSSKTQDRAGRKGELATAAVSPARDNSTRSRAIDLPIQLKGLDSSEFRLRLRHYLKKGASGSGSLERSLSAPSVAQNGAHGHALNIRALAFADACSYVEPFCRNNGECRPTGPAQAECVCPAGFTGRFCEHVRPCQVLYTAPTTGHRLTGDELCRSVGARCVDQLPVMRCEWPNDRYYQCKKLFKLDATGQGYTAIGNQHQHQAREVGPQGAGASSSDDDADADEATLREKLNKLTGVVGQQAKLIIILAVFIVAILVFAVVLVGSMVGRLRKSSKRLKLSQGEVHELSRRAVHPGGPSSLSRAGASTSGSQKRAVGPFNRPKSASPASVVGYNNSAFDVDS